MGRVKILVSVSPLCPLEWHTLMHVGRVSLIADQYLRLSSLAF